jgi:hypothetical protein
MGPGRQEFLGPRYAHLASDPVKAAATTVAAKIADAMQGNSGTPSKIVPLKESR